MRIVEEDFILEPETLYLFNLTLKKKIKNKETGEYELKEIKSAQGCTLAHAIAIIARTRAHTKFESETPYLMEYLQELIKCEKELISLCKESFPENFDTGD